MKKTYSPPDVIYESFSLSTCIAGDCEVHTQTPAKEQCALPMEGLGNVFLVGMINCNGTQITDEMSSAINGFCYHVPIENSTLFNS